MVFLQENTDWPSEKIKITELKQCYIWKLDKKTGMALQIKKEIGTEWGEKICEEERY